MKKWTALVGFAVLCLAHGAGAQTLISNPSVSGSATASITSSDYRYTKHTRGGSGRGGHTTTYYSWDPHVDELMNKSLAMMLNGSSGTATATGTFYAPTYNATASGMTSLSNSANSAIFTTIYQASTTINTPQIARQRVTATAQAGSTYYFTLSSFSDVTVTANGSANGALALYGNLDEGVGVILALNGAGTVATSSSLAPGNYWISSSASTSAVQDTLLNSLLNLGSTNANYTFTVTFSKNLGGD